MTFPDMSGFLAACRKLGEAMRTDAVGTIEAFRKLADELWFLRYHDDLCGMNDGSEWDVFI